MRTCCFFGDDILPSLIEIKIGHYDKDSYEPISISYNWNLTYDGFELLS